MPHLTRAHKDAEHFKKPYGRLALMAGLSFFSMYALMYAMVNSLADVYWSFNQFYMAGLMTAPMVMIEIALMRGMYPDKKMNAAIAAISAFVLIISFIFIRQQTAISDKQFLRSMITHHSSAILMCEKAQIQDPDIKELCGNILSSQQIQIDQMRVQLGEY